MALALTIGKFLLGGLGWLKNAISAAFKWCAAHPALTALILALGALWLQNGRLNSVRRELVAKHAIIEQMDAKSKAAAERYKADEKELSDKAKTITKDKNDEIDRIASARDVLLEQLRSRPYRPAPSTAAVASNGEAAAGCTGAVLFREDSEFLAREAARADTVRVSLKACYAQYDEARDMLAGLATPNP